MVVPQCRDDGVVFWTEDGEEQGPQREGLSGVPGSLRGANEAALAL